MTWRDCVVVDLLVLAAAVWFTCVDMTVTVFVNVPGVGG